MEVLAGVAVGGPGRLVDDVGRDGADLDEAVVLDEDRVARQVAVDDGRLGPLQRIRKEMWLTISSHLGPSWVIRIILHLVQGIWFKLVKW